MLIIAEALAKVIAETRPSRRMETVPTDGKLGRVLAENIVSDLDSPPHDKSIVDGYALVSAALRDGPQTLPVVEEVAAGQIPRSTITAETAARIMTGAPIPRGADAVVMLERCEQLAGGGVRILEGPIRPGQNIMRQGASFRQGTVVLPAGTVLRGVELGLLAELGRVNAALYTPPCIAVLATGNELVPPEQAPAAGQIRNSNGGLLTSLALMAGGGVCNLGIARDDKAELRGRLQEGLASDILVISGGVSAGDHDLTPQALLDLGVRQVFHKVNLKPGKPLWFGVLDRSATERTLVFGLPGNPVSGLVCFQLFVRPAIHRLAGIADANPLVISAPLAAAHQQRGERDTFWPARLEFPSGAQRHQVTPLSWRGSGDLRTLVAANCLAFFPAGDRAYQMGDEVSVHLL